MAGIPGRSPESTPIASSAAAPTRPVASSMRTPTESGVTGPKSTVVPSAQVI